MRGLVLGLCLACGSSSPLGPKGPVLTFEGACDASGAVALSPALMVVGDDEDNVLRVYDAERGGKAVASLELSPALGVREVDLEAATRLGDRAYWMTSHGRSKKAKPRPERLRFFATTAPPDGAGLAVVGQAYEGLLEDLAAEPRLAPFALTRAAELAPKAPGGLNIEGLTATPEGTLLIGFRNPIPGGRALIVPLLNGPALVEGGGARATFGEPRLLDLDGRGIRAITWWRGRYFIVAGHYDEGGGARIYGWDGGDRLERIPVELGSLNPEGFFSPEELDRILIISDDGSKKMDGTRCKELPDSARKRFRAAWIRPTSGAAATP